MAARSETRTLAPEPQAAGEARRFTQRVLSDADLDPEVKDVAILLTSETVTNAVVHGDGEVGLTITIGQRSVRIEVGDDGGCWPVVGPQDLDSSDGRGLAMVESEATRWGVEGRSRGKVVWFEIIF